MALCLGMLLRDLNLAQFGLNDPDDTAGELTPEYVAESIVPFEDVDQIILPLCTEMTDAIGAAPPVPRTSERVPVPAKTKDLQESVLPVVQNAKVKRSRAGTSESVKGAGPKKPKRK